MGDRARTGAAAAPYRPVAGPALTWPDAFGTRFTVFVDTEEEFDWNAPLRRDAASLTALRAVPVAHRRFAAAGVGLTWMIDHPVARDPYAVEILAATLADGRSAVGTQLHPWVNPPFDEELTGPNSFVGNLSPALEAAKLDMLTETIAAAFGRRPLIYRAGRYGVGPATWALLAERGYRVDSSLRARYDYSAEGGPDFSRIGNDCFLTAEGPLALPLTTVLTGRLRSPALYNGLRRVPKGRGIAARTGLVQRVALTPEDMPRSDVLEAIRIAHGDGLRLLAFSFHSPSLDPGHTPYVRDAADLAEFWRWWDGVLDLLARLGIVAASLDEIIAAAGMVGPAGLEPATKPL